MKKTKKNPLTGLKPKAVGGVCKLRALVNPPGALKSRARVPEFPGPCKVRSIAKC